MATNNLTMTLTDADQCSMQVTGGGFLCAAESDGNGMLHSTGLSVRLASRFGSLASPTAGLAPGLIQANLIVLPSAYASDFRNLCARNPVPCPLLAESSAPGRFDSFKSYIPGVPDNELFFASDDGGPLVDIRTDIPRYNIYHSGKLLESGCTDTLAYWDRDKSVAFLIGCSFSFETALAEAGLKPRHIERGLNVPMYRTNIPLCPAGVFQGSTYVVSMRPYKKKDVEKVRNITRAFGMTHGEPIDWGWDAVSRLGIKDLDIVDWGHGPVTADGRHFGKAMEDRGRIDSAVKDDNNEEVPVFWGCGVTPQEAILRAGDRIAGPVIGHMPGHMLLLDVRDEKTRYQI